MCFKSVKWCKFIQKYTCCSGEHNKINFQRSSLSCFKPRNHFLHFRWSRIHYNTWLRSIWFWNLWRKPATRIGWYVLEELRCLFVMWKHVMQLFAVNPMEFLVVKYNFICNLCDSCSALDKNYHRKMLACKNIINLTHLTEINYL